MFHDLKFSFNEEFICVIAYDNKSSQSKQFFEVTLLGIKTKDSEGRDCLEISQADRLVEEIEYDESIDHEVFRKNLPQFVNFSLKAGDYPLLLVFMRIPDKFYVFAVAERRLLKLGPQQLPVLQHKANVYLDDGCIVGNQIILSLQCNTLIKLTFRV